MIIVNHKLDCDNSVDGGVLSGVPFTNMDK